MRDLAVHAQVLRDFTALAASLNLTIRNLTFSPVKGPEGNIEFLAHLSMQPGQETLPDIDALVAQAHTALKGVTYAMKIVVSPNPYRDKQFKKRRGAAL